MSDVTPHLQQIESGDLSAAEHLLQFVYGECHRLAQLRTKQESADHTLHSASLAHEILLTARPVEARV